MDMHCTCPLIALSTSARHYPEQLMHMSALSAYPLLQRPAWQHSPGGVSVFRHKPLVVTMRMSQEGTVCCQDIDESDADSLAVMHSRVAEGHKVRCLLVCSCVE